MLEIDCALEIKETAKKPAFHNLPWKQAPASLMIDTSADSLQSIVMQLRHLYSGLRDNALIWSIVFLTCFQYSLGITCILTLDGTHWDIGQENTDMHNGWLVMLKT